MIISDVIEINPITPCEFEEEINHGDTVTSTLVHVNLFVQPRNDPSIFT